MIRSRTGTGFVALAAIASAWLGLAAGNVTLTAAQAGTPTVPYTCQNGAASSVAGSGDMMMGTPPASMGDMNGTGTDATAGGEHDMADANVEFDQLYIDMMIPHHEGIIALAQAAQGQLTDDRLQAIAQAIISAQQDEITELQTYREQWYGSSQSMPMDQEMMGILMQEMPGRGDLEMMATQMDPEALVAAFCFRAGEDADLAFIDLSIPHHEMAILASEGALENAKRPEIRDIANRVIAAQTREIEELRAIRSELANAGTPAA